MTLKLKSLDRQVVVITGATSGIGLSTARAAAARGATLMLAARNEEALKSVCDDLAGKGAKTAYVVADVGVEADVELALPAEVPAASGRGRARRVAERRNPVLASSSRRTIGDMPGQSATGYLPGDPRYGLQGDALKDYYRTKPAQWAIYCWDKPGTAETRRALLAEQKSY